MQDAILSKIWILLKYQYIGINLPDFTESTAVVLKLKSY
jgi:hypothetical protein